MPPSYSARPPTGGTESTPGFLVLPIPARFPLSAYRVAPMTTTISPARVALKKLELVRIRASQLNGCAFCLDMHTKDARAGTEQRIYALNAWRETPFFSQRERAALALTEAVTLVQDGHVPDEVYAEAAEVFVEPQLAALIWAATVINAYNRIAIATRMVPGAYQPAPK
ncbi:carboxymuconolactone decarboxylase family protein [Streptomyces sp. NPDC001406]|uniref:carboxymuconolactone decarboxylase family protein n=1 Tax=Streptomyces sp. NPDC001406 TaxID=3364572 RepID=UPI003698872D